LRRFNAGGVAPAMAVNNEAIAGVERLAIEELIDITFSPFQP
jgi:hypothetical protein